MTKLWWMAVLAAGVLAGCNVTDDDEKSAQELNVNSRYTVESVTITVQHNLSIPDPLRTELDSFVGTYYDHSALEKAADRIKKELRVTDVSIKVARGNEPDHVIVNFEVTRSNEHMFDLNVGKFVYDSKEGWSGDGGATMNIRGNALSFGLVSNSDSTIDRYAGVHARFERKKVLTDRLRIRLDFSSYHDEWNQATLNAAPADEIYRWRESVSPMATVVIADPLELDFGVDFARFRVPFATPAPADGEGSAAAKTESSNAVVSTLRYHQRWGSEHDSATQELNASYSISSATNLLDTDRNFTRQVAKARYKYRHARNTLELGFLSGKISGDAPLYERFVLGDSTTLRGWNKFDLDPLGGSHVAHGSVDYGYRIFQVFYDAGAVWDRSPEAKQSVGAGFKKEGFQLAVAFPLRAGRADPIFYAGMNF